MFHRVLIAVIFVLAVTSGCASSSEPTGEPTGSAADAPNPSSSGDASTVDSTPSDEGDRSDESGDCPDHLTTVQVSDAVGIGMQLTLAASNQLGTVCEWHATEDSAISVNFRTYTEDDLDSWAFDTDGVDPLPGWGDEAFRNISATLGAQELFVRSGNLRFMVWAFDVNSSGAIDEAAATEALASLVLE